MADWRYGPVTQFRVEEKVLTNVRSHQKGHSGIEAERSSNARVMCERKELASISPLHLRGEEVHKSEPQKLRTGHDGEDRDFGVFEGHYQTRKRTR